MENEKTKCKYNHVWIEKNGSKIAILDMPKGDMDSIEIVAQTPILMYDYPVFDALLHGLSPHDQTIIMASIEEILEKKNKKFEYYYFDILLDFILSIYGDSVYKIAEKLWEFKIISDDYKKKAQKNNEPDERDALERRIGQMRKKNKTGTFRNEIGPEILQKICFLYGISEEFVKTGRGTLYLIPEETRKNYTAKAIEEYCLSHNKIELKKMISDILKINLDDIIEFQIVSATKERKLSTEELEIIEILIKNMKAFSR